MTPLFSVIRPFSVDSLLYKQRKAQICYKNYRISSCHNSTIDFSENRAALLRLTLELDGKKDLIRSFVSIFCM